MVILIILVALTLGGFLLAKYRYDDFGDAIGIISTILLLIYLFGVGVSRLVFTSEAAKLEGFRTTITESRKAGINLENATVTTEIAKWNEWISENKYWNETLFDIGIPDKIEKIEFIK